jgi:anti-sigma B factor antagonist
VYVHPEGIYVAVLALRILRAWEEKGAHLQFHHSFRNLSATLTNADTGVNVASAALARNQRRVAVNVNVRTRGDVHVIQLEGALRLGDAVDRFKEAVNEALSAAVPRLVVNLADVPMIDSSGVGVLVKALTSAKQRGGMVNLVNPSKFAVKTLRLVGVINLFGIYDEEESAIQSFS